jgi:hypothetical protein
MNKILFSLIFLLTVIQSIGQSNLIHYWHFNDFVSGYTSATSPMNFSPYRADFSIIDTAAAKVIYTVLPGTSNNYTTFWDQSTTGDTTNSRMSSPAGKYLRLRNPSDSMQLQFFIPSTGFKDLTVKYTVQRSSAANGATIHKYSYSLDSGLTWISTGLSIDSFATSASWTTSPVTIHITNPLANNNSKLVFRILFAGTQNTGTSGNTRLDNFTLDGNFNTISNVLLHYWHFNSFVGVGSATNPNTLAPISADSSLIDTATAKLYYRTLTGTSNNYTTYWDAVTGIDSNAQYGMVAGNGMRFRNPTDSMTAIFHIPTTGYYIPTIRFATQKSSTSNGAAVLRFSYSIDGGLTYTNSGLSLDSFITSTLWTVIPPVTINNTLADNNPNLIFRIQFIPPGNTGTSGNTRLDNFTVNAQTSPSGGSTGDNTPPNVSFSPLNNVNDVLVSTQPVIGFNEEVRLLNGNMLDSINVDTIVELRLNSASGNLVPFNAQVSGNKRYITIIPNSGLNYNTNYYIALKSNTIKDTSNNIIAGVQSAIFTTEATQTIFSPGDILPIAYRMNATGTDDEIALLTFVNILPNTKIKLTDQKYTNNTIPQCAGGIEWKAPQGGVSAGSVISIKTDAGTTNIGSVTGSTFGLSSGGDQVLIYTGLNTNPSYITALSSNNWINSNSSCSGSYSMIPNTLTNYTTAFSLNAINAYYNGSQLGTISQLKQNILDTTNWIGIGSGTPAQQWPTWIFFGPPTIIKAEVKNSTTIQIIYSSDMDSISCVDASNYTGISNISSIQFSSNGSQNDTVYIIFSQAFATGVSYNLTISNVKNSANLSLFTPYIFSFNYETKIQFKKEFIVLEENAGSYNIELELNNPSTSSVNLKVRPAPWSTADSIADFSLSSQVLNFSGSSNNLQNLNITISDDQISEQDEYLVLELTDANGLTINNISSLTLYIRDNDNQAPSASQSLELVHITSFDPNALGSSAEVVVYDSTNKILITTSALQKRFDIIDFSNPAYPQTTQSVDVSNYGGITSVAVHKGLIAVASPNANEQLQGSVLFYNAAGVFQKQVIVGSLPDMITFSHDGKKVLTANEGQPNDAYTIDPEGSVSVVDLTNGIANLTQANVKTLGFSHFNASESALINAGVRKTKSSSTLAQDLEPEYITISKNNQIAWVSLQENNSIAEIDLSMDSIVGIFPLGTKNMNQVGNGFDASDNNSEILIANWPIKAFYMPDAIANYVVNNEQYIIMANEGDEKEYGGLNERTTVGNNGTILDSMIFPNASLLKKNYNLGRLRITNLNGDIDNDGAFEELYCVGPRSFSIWNQSTNSMAFESGDLIERITKTHPLSATIFNADNEGNTIKSRSRTKGPEPEGVTIGQIAGHYFAFVTLERTGGVMVFDVSNPTNPEFVDYYNTRTLSAFGGDNGPETVIFIDKNQSADGKYYLVIANEISGTLTIYQILDHITSIEVIDNKDAKISMFPNPNNTEHIHFNQKVKVELFDINGRLITNCENCLQLDISELKTGIYLVRINNTQIEKLVVN